MITIAARTLVPGIAIGTIKYCVRENVETVSGQVFDPEKESTRFLEGRDHALKTLRELIRKLKNEMCSGMDPEVLSESAAILEAQELLLLDEEFQSAVTGQIRKEHCSAEAAIVQTVETYQTLFEAMDDEFLKARVLDLKDAAGRIMDAMLGLSGQTHMSDSEKSGDGPYIYLTDELTPGRFLELDHEKLLGIVTERGSMHSHTAILARNRGIPMLTGICADRSFDGKNAIADGEDGRLILDPDAAVLDEYRQKIEEKKQKQSLLQNLIGQDSISSSGQKIRLYANISGPEDLPAVLKYDAEGIGLFRSEFLCLQKKEYPSEEEQFCIYRTVLEAMDGKPVTIRTMDLGGDKISEDVQSSLKDSASDCRGIRFSLEHPELFRIQLRALYRASAFGTLFILYPMITSLEEVRRIKEISMEVRAELQRENVELAPVREGIMIETPAAALLSDRLAKEVDFFSIGTNDLTQYTLARDRMSTDWNPLWEEPHPAVLRLIAMTAENAEKAGIPVGICGDLAADSSLAETFLKMKIKELSMAPEAILPMRKVIREL